MEDGIKEGVFKVVRFVASPLRFFALAIVGLLAAVVGLAWKSTLPSEITALLIYILLCAVGVLVVMVTYLIICHPRKLVFDQEAHLTYLRERLGDSTLLETYISGMLPGEEPPSQIERGAM
ncbi:MAG: hypothetical protein GX654_15910 [Desulfatiglans sp.]|nr:hypothetical protein [Desulfatiglans sp.]